VFQSVSVRLTESCAASWRRAASADSSGWYLARKSLKLLQRDLRGGPTRVAVSKNTAACSSSASLGLILSDGTISSGVMPAPPYTVRPPAVVNLGRVASTLSGAASSLNGSVW